MTTSGKLGTLICRCPGCSSLFEVTETQLARRTGLVRCGDCDRIFNATWNLIDDPALATFDNTSVNESLDADGHVDDAPAASQIKVSDVDPGLAATPRPNTSHSAARGSEPRLGRLSATETSSVRTNSPIRRPTSTGPRRSGWMMASLWLLGCLLCASLLYLQARVFFFDDLARIAAARPLLAELCAFTGCILPEVRHGPALRIVKTPVDLHPDYPGAMVVRVHLKNETNRSLAYPGLQLTLTDRQGTVVGRRTYMAGEYASAEPEAAIRAGSIQVIELTLASPHDNAVGFEAQVVSD